MTFSTPNQPSAYTWEATNEEVAARYGVPIEDIVRFDLNTAPAPPDIAQRVMTAGRFHVALSEYPPADYRRLVEAAAARYGRIDFSTVQSEPWDYDIQRWQFGVMYQPARRFELRGEFMLNKGGKADPNDNLFALQAALIL